MRLPADSGSPLTDAAMTGLYVVAAVVPLTCCASCGTTSSPNHAYEYRRGGRFRVCSLVVGEVVRGRSADDRN
jgi:hypothetical protein